MLANDVAIPPRAAEAVVDEQADRRWDRAGSRCLVQRQLLRTVDRAARLRRHA
jgi:hypothetical protein